MEYKKYKDLPPEETIKKAKYILQLVSIEVEENTHCPSHNLYYTRLEIPSLRWGTNGKGTSEIYSRASAYGEMMERLQNLHLPDSLFKTVSKEILSKKGFKYYPDECNITYSDIISKLPELQKDMCRSFQEADNVLPTDEELHDVWEKWNGTESYTGLPFYSVKNGGTKVFPYEIIRRLCRSNGIASGNTIEEALCQAICEILERYTLERLFVEELTPPEIPNSFLKSNCPELYSTIGEIESKGNYRLLVLDGSLGKSIPVVCILFIDYENQTYRIKLGCHPMFNIALERCLTELAQGTNFTKAGNSRQMTKLNIDDTQNWDTLKNWSSMFRSNMGSIPMSMFSSNPSWEFNEWGTNINYDNQKGVSQLIGLCLSLSSDIYIRNNSYLGFPSVRVYVPGITSVHKFNPLGKKTVSKHLIDVVENFPWHSYSLSREEKQAIVNLFNEDYHFLYSEKLGVSVPILLGTLNYDLGNTVAAIDCLNQELSPTLYIKAAICELKMQEKHINTSDRNRILLLFFGQKYLVYVELNWRSRDASKGLFDPFRTNKDRIDIVNQMDLKHDIDIVYSRMKDVMVKQHISQDVGRYLYCSDC